MQSVLFTVFRTDSVEKINIWVSTRENLSPGRLKSACSAQRIARILKKIVLQVVLSVFCVSSSPCCGLVWRLRSCFFFKSYSLSDYYTFQLTKIKGLIRLYDCAGFSVSSFFTCNLVRFFSRRGPLLLILPS